MSKTAPLWTSIEAVAATGGQSARDWVATGVSIDTRSLQPGDLFVALTDIRDGHDFVAQALEKGAAAALVSHRPKGVATSAPLLIVDDVLAGLEGLARAARARSHAQVIGITGSVGKTSTKDMLAAVLAPQGLVHAADKSLNNHWGVPLTLARMPTETEFALIEIGMNHAGEITPLTALARPHVAIVTTVAEAHMAAFASVKEIAHAKAEILSGLVPEGVAVLNADIGTFAILEQAAEAKGASIVTFGTCARADFRMTDMALSEGVTTVRALVRGTKMMFKIGAPGRHLAENALAVLAAVEAVGADMAVAALDLAQWAPPDGRGARHLITLDLAEDGLTLELIDDAYNANPASMAAAFDVLAAARPVDGVGRISKGRRVAFLSDMLELGAEADKNHAALADLPAMAAVDLVHVAGPMMRHLHTALPQDKTGEWHETAEALAARVTHLLDAGDVVMVKGSKGSKASLVVEAIKKLDLKTGQ
jgi:UDP-N-acetylmuramoyl-tripeptide--D-alanyl-D-alanine ligase